MLEKILLIIICLSLNCCVRGSENRWQKETHQINQRKVLIVNGFTAPYGLTIHQNKIYVPDLKAGVVYRFTKDFEYEAWLGFSKIHKRYGWFTELEQRSIYNPKSLKGPHAVAFDQQGRIFIADYYAKQIKIFSHDGHFIGNINDYLVDTDASLVGPANVYIDQKQNIWISDWDGHKIVKLNSKFELLGYLADIGEESIGFIKNGKAKASANLGGFNKPHMVAVDAEDNLYVVESANNRVQKFDSEGHALGWIGAIANKNKITEGFQVEDLSEESSIPGGFKGPCSISISKNNDLIVSDNLNNRIQFFNTHGAFQGWVGATATNIFNIPTKSPELTTASGLPGAFAAPFHAILDQGMLYVADGHNKRVQVLSMNIN